MAEGECIAIVAYEVLNEDKQRFLDSWEKANEHLKQQPGYVSSALHEAVSANPDFRFVNIGRWQSADDFRGATQSNGFREASGALEAFPIHASVYELVRS
ncbi:MAG TPA: antibiotic biosynthesis monooxygenase family protein [Acidimicrobiales bacterium]|jgi:heme oxygenase (mycobilin-producing)|nr:antibiotic biosynthesis monooxygenase family protein [Acidimicrobiales bacterium]